ncbi:PE family protein [Mycobacterium asiaticum]|nr:PE family protein [Mycobacterium asiaticum]
MSDVMVTPESMQAAATELAAIGSHLDAAHLQAAAPTLAIAPAAADEVSSGIAQLFCRDAEEYQQLAGQVAAFHEQFEQRLTSGAAAYASAETGNAAHLQDFVTSPGAPGSAAASLFGLTFPTTLEEITAPLLGALLTILVGPPLLLFLAGLVYFAPGILQGLAGLANGMG